MLGLVSLLGFYPQLLLGYSFVFRNCMYLCVYITYCSRMISHKRIVFAGWIDELLLDFPDTRCTTRYCDFLCTSAVTTISALLQRGPPLQQPPKPPPPQQPAGGAGLGRGLGRANARVLGHGNAAAAAAAQAAHNAAMIKYEREQVCFIWYRRTSGYGTYLLD